MDSDILIRLLALAVVGAVGWMLFRPRYEWLVKVEAGQPRVIRGKLRKSLIEDFSHVCREAAIERGWIGGVSRGRRVQLRFSRTIPDECRQRLRNVWQLD